MKISLGADEIILWLRKNGKAEGIDNFTLGRRIADLLPKDFDATFGNANEPCLWALSEPHLPMTAQQYFIDSEKLGDLFCRLSSDF